MILFLFDHYHENNFTGPPHKEVMGQGVISCDAMPTTADTVTELQTKYIALNE
jgi:hypothetical protein